MAAGRWGRWRLRLRACDVWAGDINLLARDDVTVNRSRILTFAGGDEIIWSTEGDYSELVVFRSCATSINFRRRRSSVMPK